MKCVVMRIYTEYDEATGISSMECELRPILPQYAGRTIILREQQLAEFLIMWEVGDEFEITIKR